MPESITFVRFTEEGNYSGEFQVYPGLHKYERTLEFFLKNGVQAFPLKERSLAIPEGKSMVDLKVEDVRDQFREGRELKLEDFEGSHFDIAAAGLSKAVEGRDKN